VSDDKVTTDLKFSMVPEWLIDSGCTDKALRLYTVLARYADNDDLTAYPGRALLAKRMGCHRASVDRAVEELVNLGAITKTQRVADGRYTSSLYTVHRIRRIPQQPSHTHATTPTHPCDDPDAPMQQRTRTKEREPKEPIAAAPKEKVAKRDELFEAVATACNIDWTNVTKSGRGQLNAATKELKDIDATPQQVEGKAAAYRKQYPAMPLTPSALVKHWGALDDLSKPKRQSAWETYDPPEVYY
jgi:Mg-chelatase subunit ChlI